MDNALLSDLLQEQIAYYRARAGEYDQWFLRQGRYNRGAELNAHWFSEAEQVQVALDTFAPTGRVLELACGTGLWTQHLVRYADSVTALDASSEVLAINRARVGDDKVRYVQADILDWTPNGQYALCSSVSGFRMCRPNASMPFGGWCKVTLLQAGAYSW